MLFWPCGHEQNTQKNVEKNLNPLELGVSVFTTLPCRKNPESAVALGACTCLLRCDTRCMLMQPKQGYLLQRALFIGQSRCHCYKPPLCLVPQQNLHTAEQVLIPDLQVLVMRDHTRKNGIVGKRSPPVWLPPHTVEPPLPLFCKPERPGTATGNSQENHVVVSQKLLDIPP